MKCRLIREATIRLAAVLGHELDDVGQTYKPIIFAVFGNGLIGFTLDHVFCRSVGV